MSEQSDNGDRMEIDFSCNSKSRRHYSATCRTLSVQTPADLSPRSSPKLCPSPDTSCTHRSTGRSPPKSIVSSVDIKRSLSGAVHGISRSPPSSHTYLSPTLERVSEVPGVELVDNYTAMKPGQGLLPCEKYVYNSHLINNLPNDNQKIISTDYIVNSYYCLNIK